MNCNQAFDCLTGPASSDSRELEMHLAGCARCRQMREVLEPALELFKPASASPAVDSVWTDAAFAESRNAPVVTPESVQLAQNAAARLNRAAQPARPLLRRMVALSVRYTAALAIGACLAFGVVGVPENDSVPTFTAAHCVWTDAREPDATLETRIPALVSTCVACHIESSTDGLGKHGLPPAAGCLWRNSHTGTPAADVPADRPAVHGVVLSCVACHLEQSDSNPKSADLAPRHTDRTDGALPRIVAADQMQTLPQWPAECASWVTRAMAVVADDRAFSRNRV